MLNRLPMPVISTYARVLGEISGKAPRTFRAGGFCVEPFGRLAPSLKKAGIYVDSSVVPGMHIEDDDKGVDFRGAPGMDIWRFSEAPTVVDRQGEFIEIPVGSQMLPFSYYWGRLFRRLIGQSSAKAYGDGSSKRIGPREIARRLAGFGRCAELSLDWPKNEQLSLQLSNIQSRWLWQIMGHPKLLSDASLADLRRFVTGAGFDNFATLLEAAKLDSALFEEKAPPS